MHGDHDPLVPVGQSQLLADALKAAGVDCDFQIIKGAGHGTGFGTPEIRSTIVQFFDKQLGRKG